MAHVAAEMGISRPTAHEWVRRWRVEGEGGLHDREQYPDVTGVTCGNDLLALGVVAGLISQGVRVPEEVSVVGFDDIEIAEQNPLPLTTIRQPKAELGWVATNLLLEEPLRGAAHAHREVMFQPELVIRATTRRVDGQETDDSAPDAV